MTVGFVCGVGLLLHKSSGPFLFFAFDHKSWCCRFLTLCADGAYSGVDGFFLHFVFSRFFLFWVLGSGYVFF